MNETRLKEIIHEEYKKLTEASEISYEELPDEVQNAIKKSGLERSVESSWHGVHGNIVRFGTSYTKNARLDKKQLLQLIKNSKFRWLDIEAMGC